LWWHGAACAEDAPRRWRGYGTPWRCRHAVSQMELWLGEEYVGTMMTRQRWQHPCRGGDRGSQPSSAASSSLTFLASTSPPQCQEAGSRALSDMTHLPPPTTLLHLPRGLPGVEVAPPPSLLGVPPNFLLMWRLWLLQPARVGG